MRIEPPPSLACATGNMPAAVAAAGPSAGPAGGALQVPGVPGDAIAIVLGGCDGPELGRVGAGREDEASPAEGLHDQLALPGGGVGHRPGSVGDRPAGDGGQILDGDRHTVEARQLHRIGADHGVGGRPGGLARLVVVAPDDRHQAVIERVDASQGGVEDLDRADLPGSDGSCHLKGGGIAVVVPHGPEDTEAA